ALLLSVGTNIKTLFTRNAGEEHVTAKEFERLEKLYEIDHEKLTTLVTRLEFNEIIKTFNANLVDTNEKIADLRVGTEQMYRSINNDVQVLVDRVLNKIEKNQTWLALKFNRNEEGAHEYRGN